MIDVTNEENRTWRLAFLAGVNGISLPLAHLASSYIYEYGGSWAAWGTSLIIMGLALLYVIFLLEETVNLSNIGTNNKINPVDRIKKQAFENVADNESLNVDERNNCKELVNVLNNAWYCFVVTFRKHEGYKRACTCLLLATILLGYFIRGER